MIGLSVGCLAVAVGEKATFAKNLGTEGTDRVTWLRHESGIKRHQARNMGTRPIVSNVPIQGDDGVTV
jgi:hypothetical protein